MKVKFHVNALTVNARVYVDFDTNRDELVGSYSKCATGNSNILLRYVFSPRMFLRSV